MEALNMIELTALKERINKKTPNRIHDCDKCGCKKEDLEWNWYNDIRFLSGSAGYDIVCPNCGNKITRIVLARS